MSDQSSSGSLERWTNVYDQNRYTTPHHNSDGIQADGVEITETTTPSQSDLPLSQSVMGFRVPFDLSFIPDDISAIPQGSQSSLSEYPTPEKKVQQHRQLEISYDGDDDTLPETPPPNKHSVMNPSLVDTWDTTDESRARSHQQEQQRRTRKQKESTIKFRRMVICSLGLGIVLLGTVAALAVVLYGVRDKEVWNPSTGSSSSNNNNQDEEFPSVNEVDEENDDGWLVITPVPVPSEDTELSEDIMWVETIVLEQSSQLYSGIDTLMTDPTSVQVLTWLANDPSIRTYTPSKVLQRYALGVIYWSLIGQGNTTTTEMEAQVGNGEEWMSYADECRWQTTNGQQITELSMCNEDNILQSLHFEDNDWEGGRLVSEIALLPGLKRIILKNNQMIGTLPTSIGMLTTVKNLILSHNQMTGSLPTELGSLTTLVTLGLGDNLFSGSIPTEMGNLNQLTLLDLNTNSFNGLIPKEFGDLSSITHLALYSNELEGPIPEELGSITTLQKISLEGNQLSGELPVEVCDRESFVSASVDCDLVTCSCCEKCNEFPVTQDPALMLDDTTDIMPEPPESDSCHSVQTSKRCFTRGETVGFTIMDCNPEENRLLAMFRSKDVHGDSLRNPLFWQPTCGDTACNGTISENALTFEDDGSSSSSQPLPDMPWPLKREEYVLIIIQSLGENSIHILAEGEPFQVTDDACV